MKISLTLWHATRTKERLMGLPVLNSTIRTLLVAAKQHPWLVISPMALLCAAYSAGTFEQEHAKNPANLVAETQFTVHPADPNRTPPLVAITRWMSSEETQQAVSAKWKAHHKQAPAPFSLTFRPDGHAIVCQVRLTPNDKTVKPAAMASNLAQMACEMAQNNYKTLFSTPPRFNQEYAFHRLHSIETTLSKTLAELSTLSPQVDNVLNDLKTVQSIESSVYYRTMMAVNQHQQKLLSSRYQNVMGQVKSHLPLKNKDLSPKAISHLLSQNQKILTLEKAMRTQEKQWQKALKQQGPEAKETQQAQAKYQHTQTALAKALHSAPSWSKKNRNNDAHDQDMDALDSGWIPVRWSAPTGKQDLPQELPAVQTLSPGAMSPEKPLNLTSPASNIPATIQYRPLNMREIALLEDLSHLNGSLSNSRKQAAQSKQQHGQAQHALGNWLSQREHITQLLEKKAFLEQNYNTWSELASRQAILNSWQQENSTGSLSPMTVRYSHPVGLYGGSDLGIDWEFLTQPGIAMLLTLFSLCVGLCAALLAEQKPTAFKASPVQKPKLEAPPIETPKQDAPKASPAQKKPNGKAKIKPEKAAPNKLREGLGNWLKQANPLDKIKPGILGGEKPALKPIETLTVPPDGVEAPHLFLATLQDPASSVSQAIDGVKDEIAARFGNPKTTLISGNTVLASALAIAYSREQKPVCLLEVTQEEGLMGYLFHMNGPEGLSDLFLNHLDIADLLRLIEKESGVAHLTALPQGTEAVTFAKQLPGWKKLLPYLESRFERVLIATPAMHQSNEWAKVAELLKPDLALLENLQLSEDDTKRLQRAMPQAQLVMLQ